MNKTLIRAAAAAGLGFLATRAAIAYRDERRSRDALAANLYSSQLDLLGSTIHNHFCEVAEWPHEGHCTPDHGSPEVGRARAMLAILDRHGYASDPAAA